jgi:hypothetical protein
MAAKMQNGVPTAQIIQKSLLPGRKSPINKVAANIEIGVNIAASTVIFPRFWRFHFIPVAHVLQLVGCKFL